MVCTKQIALWFRSLRPLIVVACTLFTGSCVTQGAVQRSVDAPAQGVALIGSTAKIGLNAPVDQSRVSAELAARLAVSRAVTVTPSGSVRDIVGAAPHDEMMAFYARHGRFAPYQVQRLMAAKLPASLALAVRLESDVVDRLPLIRENVVNSSGMVLADREQRTYVTRRTTRLSAILLNLHNGRVVWTRQYRVVPEHAATSRHRVGESFGASVAAAVANSLLHGLNDNRYPEPPAVADSINALLQEVADNAPIE